MPPITQTPLALRKRTCASQELTSLPPTSLSNCLFSGCSGPGRGFHSSLLLPLPLTLPTASRPCRPNSFFLQHPSLKLTPASSSLPPTSHLFPFPPPALLDGALQEAMRDCLEVPLKVCLEHPLPPEIHTILRCPPGWFSPCHCVLCLFLSSCERIRKGATVVRLVRACCVPGTVPRAFMHHVISSSQQTCSISVELVTPIFEIRD